MAQPRPLRRPHEQMAKIIRSFSQEHACFKDDEVEPMDIDIDEDETGSDPSDLKPIIIDGCNICHQYSEYMSPHDKFSAKGLSVTYDCLKKLGYQDQNIVMIMKRVPQKVIEDAEILEKFENQGLLFYAPSRQVNKVNLIQSDDDLFILKTAKELDGIVLSNDQFRHQKSTHPEYKDVIEKRLIQPRFIRGKLILPDDPLGKDGPKLDEFLKKIHN